MRKTRLSTGSLAIIASLIIAALFISPSPAEAQSTTPVLSAADGTLFLVYNGTRRAVSPTTLAALGINEQASHIVSRQAFDTYTEMPPVPELSQGSLITGPDGWPYLLLDGLRPIPDEETFYASGWGGYQKFSPTPIATIDPSLFALIPRRAPLVAAKRTGPGLFEWGNCTWWVAQRRAVTWLGNGSEWYDNARAQGYAVGNTPLAGAILVQSGRNVYGHVAYVESVNGTSFTVSEMNVNGLGVLGSRTYDMVTNPPSGFIGFVYWRFGEEPAATQAESTVQALPMTRPTAIP